MPHILEVFWLNISPSIYFLKIVNLLGICILFTISQWLQDIETCVWTAQRAWSPYGGVTRGASWMFIRPWASLVKYHLNSLSRITEFLTPLHQSQSRLRLRYYQHKHYHNIITGSLILHGMTETTLYRLTDADAVTTQKASPRTEAHVSQQRSEHLGGTSKEHVKSRDCRRLDLYRDPLF